MKTLIVGDSHALTLNGAARGRDDVVIGFIGPGSVLRNLTKDNAVTPEYARVLVPADRRALIIGNEVYNALCTRIESPTEVMDDFEILGTGEANIRPCLLISQALMKEGLRQRLAPLKEALKIVPMDALISGPPPTRDEAKLKAAYDAKNIDTVSFAPARLRLLCWQMQTEIMKEIAQSAGIPFIEQPSQIYDAQGFLDVAYTKDGFHGNADYGRVILDHALAEISA